MSNQAVRITGPGAVVGAVPAMCGFVPRESLVALCLHAPRLRVGLTLRVDLPRGLEEQAVPDLADRLAHERPEAVVLVVFTEAAGVRPEELLVEALTSALAERGVDVKDALLVRGGRWWSYLCDEPSCCPPDGTPVPATDERLLASAALDGRGILTDRDALVASLAPPDDADAVRAELAAAAARRRPRRREVVAAFRAALRAGPGERVVDAAGLVVALQEVRLRDEVALLALDDAEGLLALLVTLAGRSVPPYDVPVCALVALCAWLRGDGALANVALDRALAADPAYSMALLLRAGLDGQLPPSAVRSWLRETRAVLGRRDVA